MTKPSQPSIEDAASSRLEEPGASQPGAQEEIASLVRRLLVHLGEDPSRDASASDYQCSVSTHKKKTGGTTGRRNRRQG